MVHKGGWFRLPKTSLTTGCRRSSWAAKYGELTDAVFQPLLLTAAISHDWVRSLPGRVPPINLSKLAATQPQTDAGLMGHRLYELGVMCGESL